jgi:hypothetical protein
MLKEQALFAHQSMHRLAAVLDDVHFQYSEHIFRDP